MISYLAIYIGSVFLIASAAVLALQQLSEAADNIDRYELLRKIGVDEEMINRSILVQIAIYFMIPLSLAIVHSIVGLKISSDIVSVFGDGSIMNYIIPQKENVVDNLLKLYESIDITNDYDIM